MVKLMGDKLFEMYAKLWNKYGSKKLSLEDIRLVMPNTDDNTIIVMLHRLNREKVLLAERRKEDSRFKQYFLKPPARWIHEKLIEVK